MSTSDPPDLDQPLTRADLEDKRIACAAVGADLYVVVAASLLHKPPAEVTDDERKMAKRWVYRQLYTPPPRRKWKVFILE